MWKWSVSYENLVKNVFTSVFSSDLNIPCFLVFFNFRHSLDDSLTDTNVHISYLAQSCDIKGQDAFFPHQKALKKLLMSQPAFTCSNLTIETVEKRVKYVESYEQKHQNNVSGG